MITPHPELIVGFFVTFMLLLIFLNYVLFVPMFKHLDARKAHLSGDLGTADKEIEETAKLKAEAIALVGKAKQEVHRIKEEAQKEAKAQADLRVAETQAAIAAEMSSFEEAIADEQATLKKRAFGRGSAI
ncbi:hypothetical protein AGMMS50229_18460 [Campylobacterota bacterium]|nr:hypothetical protein AGMMS50229_18460 [Campylobacterota bacterium]